MGYDLRFSGLKPKLKYIMVGIKVGKSHVPEPRLSKNYHRNHKRICRREGRALFTGHKTSALKMRKMWKETVVIAV